MTESEITESGYLNLTDNGDNSPSAPGFELKLPSFSVCLRCMLSGGSGSVESQVRGARADKEAGLLSEHRADKVQHSPRLLPD